MDSRLLQVTHEKEWGGMVRLGDTHKGHGMSSLRGSLLWLLVSELPAHVYPTAVGL